MITDESDSEDLEMQPSVVTAKSTALSEVQTFKVNKPTVRNARDWNSLILVPINEKPGKRKPFPQLSSNLITLTILQFMEQEEAINAL